MREWNRDLYYKYFYEILLPDGEYKEHDGFGCLPAQKNDSKDEEHAQELILKGVWKGVGETTDKYGIELLDVKAELVSELEFKRYEKANRDYINYKKAIRGTNEG